MSASTSDAGDAPLCRVCWEEEDERPGGHIALHCHCTTGVHDRCLLQWILSENGRDNLVCELCTGRWQGAISVSIAELAEQAAAYKRAAGGSGLDEATTAELAAALEQMRERNQLLAAALAAAEAAEAARQRDFEAMKRIARRDRNEFLAHLRGARAERRSHLRWVPAALLVLLGAFCAGAHWQQSQGAGPPVPRGQAPAAAAAAAIAAASGPSAVGRL
ncbi:hypothetical protein CHLNCDRAFT_144220 [Chlorella variabilis]|uniref:RING-CH-type domain-containing protein n=1 Tax=Chlorella variabilis TaxID=554065 RepID=E1ZC69_CHLVA|nr:hypothetical protein CHLNCDRAFT_144220 [Chlorella variabilis]EFN56758.1 hypothetical protein CHLNCDRAFT_144220 [Chlorella variabilis]|eukprot:XP_005848860.1 hypothetical protein CHLNCDRAFT_144220 [Chlorella variabilis]